MTEKQLKKLLELNNAVLFGQLIKHFEEQFSVMNEKLVEHDQRFDQIMTLLQHMLKRLETDEQERLIINHQLKRHLKWIGQLARKTGTKLVPALD